MIVVRSAVFLSIVVSLSACSGQGSAKVQLDDTVDEAASAAVTSDAAAPRDAAHKAGVAAMQAMPETQQLDLAYDAVFGDRGPEIENSGERWKFDGGKVMWLDEVPILLAPASNVEPWPIKQGALGIFYLWPDGQKFSKLKGFPFAIGGSSMGSPPEWKISRDIAAAPVIISTTSSVRQGTYCEVTVLTELGHDAPRKPTMFGSAFDDSGGMTEGDVAQSLKGEIKNVVKDKSFEVEFVGTRTFTHHYKRSKGIYVRSPGDSKEELPDC